MPTPAALDPWTTIRLYPPGPNCLFAGFIDIANQRTEVLPVDYMALQQQVVAVDPLPGGDPDDADEDIETRVVPLVFTLDGKPWYCLQSGDLVSSTYAFACLGGTEAACKASVNTLFERTRAAVAATAAAAAAPAPAAAAEGGSTDAA
jgi:hypothetical protein